MGFERKDSKPAHVVILMLRGSGFFFGENRSSADHKSGKRAHNSATAMARTKTTDRSKVAAQLAKEMGRIHPKDRPDAEQRKRKKPPVEDDNGGDDSGSNAGSSTGASEGSPEKHKNKKPKGKFLAQQKSTMVICRLTSSTIPFPCSYSASSEKSRR